MIPASAQFRQELANDNRKYQILVQMTLADNTSLTITNKDIMQGTFKIEDATSAANQFTVGSAVTGKCSFTLKNEGRYTDTFTGDGTTTEFPLTYSKARILAVIIDNEYSEIGYTTERNNIIFDEAPASDVAIQVTYLYEDAFSEYDFGYATFTAQVGLEISGTGTVEYLMLGRYTVCEPKYTDSTISLVCYDNGYKLAKAFNFTGITFPATLYTLLMAVQSQTGVNVVTSPNLPLLNSYQIAAKPNQDMTCADMVACIAQINGRFAKINRSGQLYFAWYDLTGAHNLTNGYDGGTFMYDGYTADGKPEAQLDGGTFAYNDGDNADGGSFTDRNTVNIISGLASHNISTDDVVITGVSVTEEFDESADVKRGTTTVGTDGYIVTISGNPLIQAGQAATVANYILTVIGSMTFRPFNVTCLSDPTMEAGDAAIIIDRKNNPQVGFISTRAFTVGNYEAVACDAEEPLRNAMKDLSTVAKAMSAAKSQISKLETYQALVQQQIEADRAAFSALVTNSLGGHSTRIQQQDGSYIYYFHDAAALANSTTVWRFSADTFAWTNAYTGDDSTTQWQTGFDSSGNAVLHNLSADWIKAGTLSADYIYGGTLTLGGNNNIRGRMIVKGNDGAYNAVTVDNTGVRTTGSDGSYTILAQRNLRFYKANNETLGALLTSESGSESSLLICAGSYYGSSLYRVIDITSTYSQGGQDYLLINVNADEIVFEGNKIKLDSNSDINIVGYYTGTVAVAGMNLNFKNGLLKSVS